MAKDKETPTPEDLGLPPIEISNEAPESPENPPEENTPPPKRRGRPRKDGSSGPAPERPKKSNARKAESNEALARQIMGIHQLVAMATGISECVISEQESMILATAVNAVAEEYGLALSGKTGAALQLFGAASIVYGPRIMSIRAKQAEERKKKAEQDSMTFDVEAFVRPENGTPNHQTGS